MRSKFPNHPTLLLGLLLLAALLPLGLPGRAAAQTAGCAQTVLVAAGDTLSSIAGTTLGSQGAFPRIVAATNAQAAIDPSFTRIDDPNRLAEGWKLCIPSAAAPNAPDAATNTATNGATPAAPALTLPLQPLGPLGLEAALELTDAAQSIQAALTAQPGPDGLHPLSIDYLRRRPLDPGPLVVQQTLDPGPGYSRALVAYRSDGLTLYALLTTPEGPKPAGGWPVILFNHGYIPPALYRPTERYEAHVDWLARAGYMVLRPDFRGHGASAGVARGAYGDPGYAVDILNAVAAVRLHPDADPTRIGMWGHSMGGYLTLRAMVASGDIRAGVIWSGVLASYSDLLDLWTANAGAAPPLMQRWYDALTTTYGTPATNPEFWRSISANSYLADLSGPLQLHHGAADFIVPAFFSEQLAQALRAAGQPVEAYIYANDDHNLTTSFEQAMTRTVAFFDTYVAGR